MKIQEIRSNQQNKYGEIIEYLKQDNEYWINNDKWDLTEKFFVGKKIYAVRYIDFDKFKNQYIKNEIKYYITYNFKNNLLKNTYIVKLGNTFKHFSVFINKYYKFLETFNSIDKESFSLKFNNYLLINNVMTSQEMKGLPSILDFIKDFYDDREETEKDIWYSKNINGAKIPASGANNGVNNQLNFSTIPIYYRETIKKYFKTIITKKSWNHCCQILNNLNYFLNKFYSNGYIDGFIEHLSRKDIENYLYWLGNDYRYKNPTYRCKFVSYIRTFLEYIQMAQYDKAPKKEVAFLIFQGDIPKRELNKDEVKKAKFVPEPILKQLDNNIMALDRPQYIPIYILLRETGWRGTDILNLRYNNCLEKIWNNKEENYNYYLCGEITKTGIALLKIPIRDKVAEMVQKCINKAKELSTEENNFKKYLFNTYEGKLKGNPLAKHSLLLTIKRLIEQKDIRDVNGELYHFRLHSLRHTRAKEYVEQGMGISIIQQILGHQSLQMTVYYATVSENTLYEKWKNTEDLELFKVDTKTNKLEKIELSSDKGESLIRYEYVKKNLDAVRVPFGICFKPTKSPCRQQMNHCLNCGSFCTTTENIPEYEEEIQKVRTQIEVSNRCRRELWAEKNEHYLDILEKTLEKVREHKLVHKNGKSREDL
ncbi:transposase [Clostridium pasteurianum DSM 525 = ATCC 6013]|uniref:Integrase family protein n=2 Tax=Clostridium pasteurianum DSM 525 = ATCC 6013 TaxID=1262449 RepID=A0A0H3JBA1_CLOPA|nr:transposase [Clostridium pasteurianum DSM 525 = ATCC 6013]AJA53358.1 transposase [Clostridium pasteurianum DSM 525 = ATCC 6013]ELP57434.1 phage integrase family protein [Clostridium pasteurianum DSM 525 = ATCC 6013]KRU12960.1 integrase family protein [Clostridium pasteurianum DSM 525 = ATCC 6013]KRU14617.1 integrase family protein [Clostridium pasteurianum DSM 525 = ATCC 6013]